MKTVKPFSNGTEFDMWDEKNCGICPNSKQNSECMGYKCHIDEQLTEALFSYGDVLEKTINLIGFDERHFLKDCPFKHIVLTPVEINTSVFKQLMFKL